MFLMLSQPVPHVAADPAPQRASAQIEALEPQADKQATQCNLDRTWCISLVDSETAPALAFSDANGARKLELPAMAAALGFDRRLYSIWPQRILFGEKGEYFIGLISEEHTMYSGGGAHASTLTLYHVSAAARHPDVLTIAWDSGSMIRACFSEQDHRQRRGACHDEYRFTADIRATPDGPGGLPTLHYRAWAVSYPGAVSRKSDSLSAGKLKRKDMVFVRNADCTFSRILRFDTTTGHYAPDTPLPECDDYTGL